MRRGPYRPLKVRLNEARPAQAGPSAPRRAGSRCRDGGAHGHAPIKPGKDLRVNLSAENGAGHGRSAA
jgi:hypothetical protein